MAQPLNTTTRRYRKVVTIMVTFKEGNHRSSWSNMDYLRDVLERKGYVDTVEYIIFDPVVEKRVSELPFWRFFDLVKAVDAADTLIVVCYFGHSGVSGGRLLAGVGTDYLGRSYVPRANGTTAFDLSRWQLYARDLCKSDFLFIFECCEAAFFPSGVPKGPEADKHRVETLAAGPAGQPVSVGWAWDFPRRLADDLEQNTGPVGNTAAERFARIRRPWWKASPGFWRQHGAASLIDLVPR